MVATRVMSILFGLLSTALSIFPWIMVGTTSFDEWTQGAVFLIVLIIVCCNAFLILKDV